MGRSLPDPGFAGDSGAADEPLCAALRVYTVDGRNSPVLVALSQARLLVPVVALLGAAEVDDAGLTHDKSADIATVLMRGRDGRTALLAFSSLSALTTWNSEARPVPVTVRDAAGSALQEGASALLIDVAGPTMFVVETPELQQLAQGHRLAATPHGYAWVASG